MLLAETFRSSTFKLALVCIGLFGAVVFLLFGYVDWVTETYVLGRSDRVVEAEHALLARTAFGGPANLQATIKERIADRRFLGGVYLLVDRSRIRLAGNLDRWPAVLSADGWADFHAVEPNRDAPRGPVLRAKAVTLADGSRLLVGADIDDVVRFGKKIDIALALTIILIFVLAGVASVAVTRRTVGRIDSINRTSQAIMRSDLGRRIPLRGTSDEWDRLAENLNSMLDRIGALMSEVKQVTDNVAHDLRTPLARMRGRLERARDGAREGALDQALIVDTMTDLDAVLAMFASLMRISQIETRDRKSAFRNVDLVVIAREVAELYDPAAEELGVRLHVRGDPEVMALGDRDLLFETISNLVDNALKHGGDGGDVTIELINAPEGNAVAVRDRGPSIPIDERANVLRRFYRLERSRCTPGNGLGLSLVAAVAGLHDARVDIRDDEPGLSVRLVFPTFDAGPADDHRDKTV